MNNVRTLTSSAVKAIMSKRSTIPAEAVGKRVKFIIQGDGNVIDVTDKAGNVVRSITDTDLVLQKKIFNLKANSGLAMQNERTRSYIKNGLVAEKLGADGKVHGEINGVTGDYTAHQWLSAYLNSTQISFGVLLPNSVLAKLTGGVEIAATVQKIDTDNGSLLTIDASSISVVEPESYGSTEFNLDDFMDAVEEFEDAATAKAAKAAAKAVKTTKS